MIYICLITKAEYKIGEQTVTTQEILDASDQLWILDENRATASDIIWNKQASTSDSSTTDKSSQP